MKKILLAILILTNFISLINVNLFGAEKIETLRIHYYRYDGDYNNFNVWIWEKEPGDLGGKQWNFNENDISQYGVFLDVDLKKEYSTATTIGIIIKQGGWDGYREIGGDRLINLSEIETNINGFGSLYFVEQDLNIGKSQSDLDNNIPDYRDRITQAHFVQSGSNYDIKVIATAVIKNYAIYKDGIFLNQFENSNNSKTIQISGPFSIVNKYEVEVMFENNNKSKSTVSLEKIYDTKDFEEMYTYEGKLGVIFEGNETIFRLWAPLSSSVILYIYSQGHPEYHDEGEKNIENIPLERHNMNSIENGVWEIALIGDYDFLYYTFSVTNGDLINEVTDPYSYSTGINGLRSMIVNFESTNPEGWVYNYRPDTIQNNTDYIIWELHVRDLTTHSSWNGEESYRGKFMGLTEKGTKFTDEKGTTVSTGLDHIIELGVNAVQLLPIFDFGYVDEIQVAKNPNYEKIFNWGYMPIHFNVLEGSYSTNPFNGKNRIEEFKKVIMAFHGAGIRVIMDVVYNHTGLSENSNFHKIVPGYYHRLNSSGGFSNGSGTGNETASERSMMRKFMFDSTEFLINEYNLSGFRFDLMMLHDFETMNLIGNNLKSIDESIIIYGEPWMGGSSPLANSLSAGKENINKMSETEIGAFNDDTRDGLKGSVFNTNEGGWIQGENLSTNFNKIIYGIVGGTTHSQLKNYNAWHFNPNQIINYVSAHDNNTLYDKYIETGFNLSNDLLAIKAMQIQANAIVLTSQGIPFLHAGVEFLRSKPTDSGGFDHNSYESPDRTNQLRWDRKAKYIDVFEYYKALVEIRKAYENFRMSDPSLINGALTFLETNQTYRGIAFRLQPLNVEQSDIIVIHSGHSPIDGYTKVTLPYGKEYYVLTSLNQFNLDGIEVIKDFAYVAGNSTMILVDKIQEAVTFNPPSTNTSNSSLSYVILISGMIIFSVTLISYLNIKEKKNK